MAPQSIIVYRNPIEAAFWESGLLFPIICACIIAVLAAIVTDKLLPYHGIGFKGRGNVIAVVSIVAAIATLWFMIQ